MLISKGTENGNLGQCFCAKSSSSARDLYVTTAHYCFVEINIFIYKMSKIFYFWEHPFTSAHIITGYV